MRVIHQKSASEAKKYYSASDYYQGGPEQLKGIWFGTGAEHLGLQGFVNQRHFDRLVDNLHPFENKRLTQRNHANRRVLTDITFSAPKSVSIFYGMTGDANIAEAVQQAALATFADLELDAQTRVNHSRGNLTYQSTQNIVGAAWLHVTGRPVDHPELGVHPDVQLHVHGAIINATHTGNERWTAVDLSNAVRDSGYYEALFQSRLATNMKQLGIAVERRGHNFEVVGISRELIEKFSRRTKTIEELIEDGVDQKIAAKEKISLKDARDKLGQLSRQNKWTSYEVFELPRVWRSRLTNEEAKQLDSVVNGNIETPLPSITKDKAVDFAIKHRFQNESVTRERHLLRDALMHGIADVAAEDVKKEVISRKWIRESEGANALLSTFEVLREEQELLKFVRDSRGSVKPLAPSHQIARDWLSDEQKSAVTGLLSSTDRVQILRGVAGVGKTTLMREAIEGIENEGTRVTILAPGSVAVREVLEEKEGFEANTLASFLLNEKLQEESRGGVIWLDEAGQAGTEDIGKLAKVANKIDARIILSGDKRQHKSVARGAPLKLLESQAGIKPHEVTKIRRQSGKYREAVSMLSRGDVARGFDLLDSMGNVHEIQGDRRYEAIAKTYADNLGAKKDTLVIAPTHAEREVVTNAIRRELRLRDKIQGPERKIGILKSRGLSIAMREDPFNFHEGDVVEFVTRGKGGFKSGDRLQVIKSDRDRVLANSSKGIVEVPIDSPKSFEVYRWHDDNQFAKGDLIRITKKNTANNLYNGTMVRLDGFQDDGSLKLSNGKTLDPNWGHIDHGITVTSHASQGKGYDSVLVAQSSVSFPASSPEQIYVTASRGETKIDIFTDSVDGLRRAIQRTQLPENSSDLQPRNVDNKPQLIRKAIELRLKAEQMFKKQWSRLQNWLQIESNSQMREICP